MNLPVFKPRLPWIVNRPVTFAPKVNLNRRTAGLRTISSRALIENPVRQFLPYAVKQTAFKSEYDQLLVVFRTVLSFVNFFADDVSVISTVRATIKGIIPSLPACNQLGTCRIFLLSKILRSYFDWLRPFPS